MSRIIKLVDGEPVIVDDPWRTEDDPAGSATHCILPLTRWLEAATLPNRNDPQQIAPWLSAEDEFERHIAELLQAPLIAVEFASFRDGRGYSTASLLRSRYNYTGELRAIGDVLRDQLKHMRRCGFDAFVIRSDKTLEDALKGLQGYSVHYQRSVVEPLPLFRRR